MNDKITANGSPDFIAQLTALRAHYLAQLPSKMDELEHNLAHLIQRPDDVEVLTVFHRQAHSLTGSGATYGFTRLSQCARELEHYLKSCLQPKRLLEAADQAALRALLDSVKLSTVGTQPEPLQILASSQRALGADEETNRIIYVLDDDPLTLTFLSTQLANFGYEINVFFEPDALHEKITDQKPAAILLGVMLDQATTGSHIAARLSAEIKATVPIVFVADQMDFSTHLACVRAGGAAYFVKPLDIYTLAETLDQLTHRVKPPPFQILIIEDTQSVAQLYAKTLESVGMITRIVTDPAHAMAALADFNTDLILMDMYMPNVRGDELAKVIRQQAAYMSIPIVFLSAEADLTKQMAAIGFGGDDFLTKPISLPHLVSSVMARVSRARALRGLMQRDSLTGLLNHTNSKEYLAMELSRAQRQGQPMSFAMIDIDHFKKVNDTYGHPVGDRVIKSLSRLLQQRLRKTDSIGRYGGEEFAVIMPNTDVETAHQVLDELRESFSRVQHQFTNSTFTCTFSCGVAEASPDIEASHLTELADRALYQAKHSGRNCVTKATT